MTQIAELNAHSKHLEFQLNTSGKATCWLHLLDPDASLVVPHQTSLRCDRDNQTWWSGPIYQANDSSQAAEGQQAGMDQVAITAFGWQKVLDKRLVHTGSEFQAMLAAPNGVAWQAANGTYTSPGIDTAIQLAYSATQFPTTTDAVIIDDLLNRANIDSPTNIVAGNVYGSPIQRNLTLQRFQSVGQQITQLVNVESGCDIYVDPVTRKMNLFGPGASPSPLINTGMGFDRGRGTLFTYPGNCTSVQRPQDGTQTANRVEALGQIGAGRADDLVSQSENGLFEAQDSLSEVVDPNILAAYANAEVTVRSKPWTIITFTPRPVTTNDATASGVPRPFDDFFLGDLVYTVIDRGRLQVGTESQPQETRVYGFNVDVDDEGIEKLSNLQTTYQGLGAL